MILSWRRRRAARRDATADHNGDIELIIPTHFRCPISLDLMKDPVTLSTGITYDRQSIETWIEAGNNTCPITNQALTSHEPIPNHSIRKMIQNWCVENRSHGIERIPTPRSPVSSVQVSGILSKLALARQREYDGERYCLDLVAKIKALARESERNRQCFVANGAGRALSALFESESTLDRNGAVVEETLSVLTLMFPLDNEAKRHLASYSSLKILVAFLESRDLSGRRNAVLVLKEIVSSGTGQEIVNDLAEIGEGSIFEALVKLVKEPICPKTTKASLTTIYYMTTVCPNITARFVEMGMVSLLLEMLVDTERSLCERALGVLDGLCDCAEGRERANGHALAMPVLVKKLLRVSDLATEFSVSILWKLMIMSGDEMIRREGGGGGGVVVGEALQVGAFQKLLLLLQVGCGEKTKEKASELLRMLNLKRERFECIDSVDFRDLRRPF